MRKFEGYASINGREIRVQAQGIANKVDEASRSFFDQLQRALAEVTVTVTPVTRKPRRKAKAAK